MTLPKKLSLVAVPLGNVEDLSARAKKAMKEAEVIFCEDSRKSQDLFSRCDIQSQAKWVTLPGSREKEVDWEKWTHESTPKNWIFISDAGTPIVNDPGLEIHQFLHRRRYRMGRLRHAEHRSGSGCGNVRREFE